MFKTSEVVPDFVLYAINAHLRRIEEQTAFATVKHISTKQIEAIEMAIPPFDDSPVVFTSTRIPIDLFSFRACLEISSPRLSESTEWIR